MSEGTARELVGRAALDAAQRDVAEALRMATQAGIGFEQGMPNARRLAADADRKATEAFRTLRTIRDAGALAPAALTAEQREACGAGADAIRGQVWASEGRQGNPNPDDPQLGANRTLMDHWRVLRRLAADAATGEPS